MTAIFSTANRNGGQGCPPDIHSLEGCATLRRARGWLMALVMVLGVAAQAADVSVKASLSRGVTVIGEPVQLQIKITNGKRAGDPPDVAAEGLDIRYVGPSTNSVMRLDQNGFHSETTTVQVYQVTAAKNGTFTIPAVEMDVDGRKYKTEPVTLTVQQSAVEDAARPQAQGKLELIVPKKTAYVGEMLPVELRLTVDARVRWQAVAMPEISGEGFTKQKMPEPQRPKKETKDGREYDVLIFKTAITPGKAGKISIGPGELAYNAQVPRARRSGPRSMFDLLDDDAFGDPFFAQVQQFKVKAEPVELMVKPLPAAGKPRDFSGAVGTFQFSAAGSPSQVKVGDPVTMKLRVSGRGNFDRVEAPALRDPSGWRSYPPSGNFKKEDSDEVGLSGTKTFEMAVIPEERKTQMPVFTFSFFDPEAEKYVTLASEPAALKVDGAKVAPPPPVPNATAPADEPKTEPDTPKGPPNPTDVLGPRYDAGARQAFPPLYERREFWMVQAGMLAALLALVGFRVRGRPNADAARSAALRREKSALLAKLRRNELDHAEFFGAAARVVQIDAALTTGADAAGVDATAARTLAGSDEETAEVIDEVFNARAELLFAGGGHDDGRVSGDERARVLAALEKFGRNHAKS